MKLFTISYTAMSDFARCPRFYQYAQVMRLESLKPPLGRIFGEAGHAGIKALYDTGSLQKCLDAAKSIWHPYDGTDIERNGNPGVRTTAKLVEILTAYHDQFYTKENWIDEGGEQFASISILLDKETSIRYRYKIDRVGQSGGVPAIQEVKFLKYPSEFITEPNNQVAGYLRATGRLKAIVTCAGVYKTSTGGVIKGRTKADEPRSIFSRDPIFYEPWVYDEWEKDMKQWSRLILNCHDNGYFPKNAPGACGDYGGCIYRTLCNATEDQKKVLMELNFKKRESSKS